MSDPFTGSFPPQGVSEESTRTSKIEAAKDYLLKQIHGLPDGDVAVVVFADSPRLLFRGHARETDQAHEPIRKVVAGGNTNIGDALLFGLGQPGLDRYKLISFLLITDGLSTAGNPIAAANQCSESDFPIRISTILIDPTPEGNDLARRISLGGDVKNVTSSTQLREAIGQEEQIHAAKVKAMAKKAELQWITRAGAVLALIVALSTLYTTLVERPSFVLLSTLAALATLIAVGLIFVAFRKEEFTNGLYKGPLETDYYVPRHFKYSRFVRRSALILSGICILISGCLMRVAANRATSTKTSSVAVAVTTPNQRPTSLVLINLATNARVVASSEFSDKYSAKFVCDGKIPKIGSGPDVNEVWCVDTNSLLESAKLWFDWDRPVLIDTVVYYGRTARTLDECWRDTRLFVNGMSNPIVKVRLERRDGPQLIMIPQRVLATNVTLEFLNGYGGRYPGASEVQIFSEPPSDEVLKQKGP